METYNVAVVGRAGNLDQEAEGNPERVNTREVFVRTGGLVDIHSIASHIVCLTYEDPEPG